MNLFRIILYFLGFLVILILFALVYLTITDYKPDKVKTLAKSKKSELFSKDTIQVLTWNIGYCGLDEKMSFFYDGGNNVRTTKEQTQRNLDNIKEFLIQQDHIDFFLLQEIDKASKRSYYIREFSALKRALLSYNGYFATNYKVPYVPVPLFKPLGKVKGGIATFATQKPSVVSRYQFPGNYSWPKNLFMLDRCFLLSRYGLQNGKDLLIINTHNSAYDNGDLKKRQMKYLKHFLLEEYQKGNYIIVGGDWNQFPPGLEKFSQSKKLFSLDKTTHIDNGYMPSNWIWAYDSGKATNRSLDKPLNKDTKKALIDFYLLSPNIQLIEVKTEDLQFKNSDHQPVYLKVKLM